MSQHPPIPPNCAEVFESNGHARARLPYEESSQTETIALWLEENSMWRPIIAAVARVGWLDEAERLIEETPEGATLPAWAKAHENADAWREWGKERAK